MRANDLNNFQLNCIIIEHIYKHFSGGVRVRKKIDANFKQRIDKLLKKKIIINVNL